MTTPTPEEQKVAQPSATGTPPQVGTRPGEVMPARPRSASSPRMERHAALKSDRGQTRIADGVVAKIAGLAAREIPGVQAMGKGLSRTIGGLRSLLPGTSEESLVTQGVSVEVGERQAAVDLDIVVYYGQSIVEVSEAVRRNVIERIESLTGLEVTEVNIFVDDLYVEGEREEQREPRVQ